MPVVIRSAALSDVPRILAIERQAAGAAHWTPAQYNKLVENVEIGVVLVAEEAAGQASKQEAQEAAKISEDPGKMCGFICARATDPEWEIENLAVAAESLRHGIATQLMRELIRRVESEAASTILLEVRESNLPARGLYEKHGFRRAGSRRVYYKDPVEDAILYTLPLNR